MCADSEANVQNAVQFLDALIKDIAADCTHWDVGAFIPKLRDYLRVTNPHKRQFLLSWVVVLDSLPHVRMLRHLPALLDGLLSMLAEPVREVRTQAANCLKVRQPGSQRKRTQRGMSGRRVGNGNGPRDSGPTRPKPWSTCTAGAQPGGLYPDKVAGGLSGQSTMLVAGRAACITSPD